MFWVLKKPSHRDASFEYPQHMFWLRKKKNNFQVHTLIWRPEKQNINLLDSDEFSHTDKSIKMGLSITYFKGTQADISQLWYISVP